MEQNYWQRKFPSSETDCYYWYWGNTTLKPNTCMKTGKQCIDKCKDYITPTQHRKQLLAKAEGK